MHTSGRWACALVAASSRNPLKSLDNGVGPVPWRPLVRVRAPATASKGNPSKALEMDPDSWDMHTFLDVQLQKRRSVYRY